MTSANTLSASINLVELDFNGLKTNLISYLRNQETFRDYDFEGSNLNLLIDLLSYNTFKNAFYLNMAISEGFLNSAQLRNSLLSHSKELNYQPRSVRSAVANITVDFEATGESQPYVIAKGSQLSSMIKSIQYTFSIPETLIVASTNTSFSFTTDIYEGIYKKDAYVFLDNVDNQRFRITNKNVDTRSISVTVYEDGSQVGDVFVLTNTLLDLNETSKVFFVQNNETGYFEIFFGDGNLGYQPKTNSLIVIDYRISNGLLGNGARVFAVDFEPTSANELTSTPLVTTNDQAQNAAEAETNESIRYYAPRHFQVQERAITTTDYEIILKTQFPEINTVSVYGGEEEVPPRFGRVFVSVDISNVDGLPESKKDEYYAFLKRRSPLSIEPIFIEPQFLYLAISDLVRYNINITTNSTNRIRTLVTDVIMAYQEDNLDDFNATLRYSQLSGQIDAADRSIISNILIANIYKKINPTTGGIPQNIDINFTVPLISNIPAQEVKHLSSDVKTISSSPFKYNGSTCILEDDSDGNMRIIQTEKEYDVTVINAGTVDYDKGLIKLIDFSIDSYSGNAIKLYAMPADKDVTSTKNTILSIEPEEIKIEVMGLRL